MALRSTVFKVELSIADIDRGRYASHAMTVALHPSETEERMMLRLLAFVLPDFSSFSTVGYVAYGFDIPMNHLWQDLIVCGAYGQSRTREWVLGGFTRDMIRHADRACLFSH